MRISYAVALVSMLLCEGFSIGTQNWFSAAGWALAAIWAADGFNKRGRK